MDIKVKIEVVLSDEYWGFSDLLNGRGLNNETIGEIKELILEDYSDLIAPGNWKISEHKPK